MKIKIGARPSRLAIAQVKEIISRLPEIGFEIITIETRGERDKTTPLSGPVPADFFTHEIEEALIDRKIDAAIHSGKDLEYSMPGDLVIAAMTCSLSPFECLVSRGGLTLEELPPGSIIGTSSLKRKGAIARKRSDLVVKDIRGNIEERLAQLDSGRYDAVLMAHAALIRLGYEHRISQIIPPEIVEPHPLQGRLAVQIRKDRANLWTVFRRLDEK